MKVQSQDSTEWCDIPITATPAGIPYDPTNDVVYTTFVAPGQKPSSGMLNVSSWVKTTSGDGQPEYWARCLVGPANNGIVLAVGTWDIYVKITDSPEIPFIPAGQIRIY